MLSVRIDLLEALRTSGLPVYYYMPPVNVDVSMPLIILEETQNDDYAYFYYEDTDTEFEIANVSYEVSIYAVNPMDVHIYLPIVEKIMKRIGFKKTWTSGDSHVDPLYCKSMRFTGKIQLIDGDYMIYSRH